MRKIEFYYFEGFCNNEEVIDPSQIIELKIRKVDHVKYLSFFTNLRYLSIKDEKVNCKSILPKLRFLISLNLHVNYTE